MALSEARRASLLAYCRIEEPTAEELLTLEGLYDAAVVRVETVRQMAERDTVVQTFPGVLTEKYVRHGQEWPMSVNELGLVLVTPKAVTLPPGGLVEARGALWEILAPHELDEFKNEYEIGRTVDL